MNVKLIAITKPVVEKISDTKQVSEYAARKCYKSTHKTGNNTNKFLNSIIKNMHTSTLEHINFTFEIDGISRTCLAQLTRHRIGFSYSVESMRYVDQGRVDNFVFPDSIKESSPAYKHMLTHVKQANEAYNTLIKSGVPKEDARFILPLGTKTNLVLTANLRALMNFFELRESEHAQWEIRALANKMHNIVRDHIRGVNT